MKTKRFLTPEDVAEVLRIPVCVARQLIESINEENGENGLLKRCGLVRYSAFEDAVYPDLTA